MSIATLPTEPLPKARRPFQDLSNTTAHPAAAAPSPAKGSRAVTPLKANAALAVHPLRKKAAAPRFQCVWGRSLALRFLWHPLGTWTLEVNHDSPQLVPQLQSLRDWRILFIKDFSETWRAGPKYEARLLPTEDLDPVGQRLFLSGPSLHACIVLEGAGFLWLNRLPEEPFVRCNWLEDASASARILPPLNLCFDLDDTLIFNAPVPGTVHPLEYVVREPPHMLVEDVDPNGEVFSSDSPFVRPQMKEFLALVCPFFRNIRIATFSVGARAGEILEHLDPHHATLLKNFAPDPITGQKPVAKIIFSRELLLMNGHVLCPSDRQLIKSGAVFWLKSLDMLDLPQKGILQRSLIIDDRTDVWVETNQDNIVRITGPDRVDTIGLPSYLNGVDGGEVGQRMLLALVNLELKSTRSAAFQPAVANAPLPARRPLAVPSSQPPMPPSAAVLGPFPPPRCPSIATPTGLPPKASRASLAAGLPMVREALREQQRDPLREKAQPLACLC